MISAVDYEFFRGFLHSRSGLALADNKHYLLESRLTPLARSVGVDTLSQLVERLKQPGAHDVQKAVVEAMTTNESLFFRDKTPFDAFATVVLPKLHAARPAGRPLRIWCAAASTGQEPYSLAMLLKDNSAKYPGRKVEIVGTDISSEALAKARKGTYTQFEVQRGLPVTHLVKYFAKQGDDWQISAELRGMVDYREFNLLNPLSALGQFDVVFCRNVLIYFDQKTKVEVLHRIAGQMPRDGYLILGGAETVVGLTERLKPSPDHRSLYMHA